MNSQGDDICALLERQALYDLALRYAQAADRRRYEDLAGLFTRDGTIEGYEGEVTPNEPLYRLSGHQEITTGLRALEKFEKTFHQVANQLVEIDAEKAHGETYCMAHHIYFSGSERWNRTMAIRYQDRFEREKDRWLFSRRQLVIDWERNAPLESAPRG